MPSSVPVGGLETLSSTEARLRATSSHQIAQFNLPSSILGGTFSK